MVDLCELPVLKSSDPPTFFSLANIPVSYLFTRNSYALFQFTAHYILATLLLSLISVKFLLSETMA